MSSQGGPQSLAQALAELIALRGYARVRSVDQLHSAWREACPPEVVSQTRPLAVKRGVLQVSVAHAPLLAELVGFHRAAILNALQTRHADLKIRDIKFKLDSDLTPRTG